jgi:2-succinyl-5-enolpyruvyl-6-hydroxy-3-cyclohexene-1-carboxylate synthase
MNPATRAARVVVAALADAGVRHVVLAPGSRSAPLAHALAAAALPDDARPADAPPVDLHVRIDERAAGFLALGLARGAGGPVAVVTTSGGAVANLHPAVLEAHHDGVPLLLLTADRPHELRGTGANQTTEQPGIFSSAVRMTFDVSAPVGRETEPAHLRRVVAEAVSAAVGAVSGDPGPVHLNLAYREPLVPDDGAWPARSPIAPPERPAAPAPAERRPRWWAVDEPTVVVAGDGAGPVARELAEAHHWPLLAEPTSGARGGPAAVRAYRYVLESLADEVRRVVVVGRPTLSRQVLALVAPPRRTVAIVRQGSATPDAGRGATYVATAVPDWLRDAPAGDPAWLERWRRAGEAAAAAVDRVLEEDELARRRMSGPRVADVVAGALGPDDVLVVGASNPARDLDLVAAWDAPPRVVANRGLSGIDGTLSTAAGLALGLGRPVRAYVGDLAFLHDAGGLLVGPLERRPDLRVVVANDDGGSIFATLEHGDPAHAAVFERVFGTPHGADLRALCEGYGVRHTRVTGRAGLARAVAAPVDGIEVVEVAVDRAGRRELHARLSAAVRDAVAALG